MKIGFLASVVLAMAFSAAPTFAWNCTTPGQVRVQVPAGTIGNGTGDGNGQVVVDNGLTFVCEAIPTVGGPSATGGSSSSTSASNSNSNATASSNQFQAQSSTASASGSNNTTFEARYPASSAAPVILPASACFKGYGGAVQTAPVGVSFGAGKIDENCAILEAARSLVSVSRLAYCKVMLSNKYVKAAKVTLADCLVTESKNSNLGAL